LVNNPSYTLAQFREYFPQFAAPKFADDDVQLEINKATSMFNVPLWDNLYYRGIGNLVAHELTMNQGLQSGAISPFVNATVSSKVGDVSKTLDAGLLRRQMDEYYSRTIYGQKYLEYRKLVTAGAAICV
jgi:hypothetical protein